jgi:hypothetical protein
MTREPKTEQDKAGQSRTKQGAAESSVPTAVYERRL